VEFGGFSLGLLQRGYIRILAFHRSRNFAHASFAQLAEPDIDSARAAPNFASDAHQQLPTMPTSAETYEIALAPLPEDS
jgi:hypothetical protein